MPVRFIVILIVSFVLIVISLPWLYGRAPGGAPIAYADVIWFGGLIIYLMRRKRLR